MNIEYEKQRVEWFNSTEGDLNKADGYNCDICKNKGHISKLDSNGEMIMQRCKCVNIRRALSRFKNSGLNADCTFDNFRTAEEWQKSIKQKAVDFCKDDTAKLFYIGGQVGAGKTHICTAVTRYYNNSGYTIDYMRWCEDSKRLKAIVNDSSYANEIDRYKNVKVLYIDDFLKVQAGTTPTNADISLAFEIIDSRVYDDDKITVISSEKTLDELMKYDQALMSRVYKKAGKYKINIAEDKNKNQRLK